MTDGAVLEVGKGEQQFLAFFDKLPAKNGALVRFFNRGDYYTVHGDDAHFAAKEVFHTTSVIKHYGDKEGNMPYVCLSKQVYETTLRELLLVRQYRVEIFEREDRKWVLKDAASPGNLQSFEEVLFSGENAMEHSAVIMSISMGQASGQGQRTVGVSFVDATLKTMRIAEFMDNDMLSNLEGIMVQIGASECLISAETNNPDVNKAKSLLERCGLLVTPQSKSCFNTKDIQQDLNRLLRGEAQSSTRPEIDLKFSMQATASLLKYLKLIEDTDNFGQFSIATHDLSQFVKLDSAAIRALNLDADATSTSSEKSMYLTGLLNRCKTPQGQRLCSQWIKQPLVDRNRIVERQDAVEAFFEDMSLRETVRSECLRKIPDLHRMAKKFQRKRGTLQDCVKVHAMANVLPALVAALDEYQGDHAGLLQRMFRDPLQKFTSDFTGFIELVEETIDLELVEERHEYKIKATYDPQLGNLKQEADELLTRMGKALRKAADVLGLEADKTIKCEEAKTGQNSFYYRVTRTYAKKLQSKDNRFRTLDTNKTGVKFTDSTLSGLSEEKANVDAQYDKIQSTLVAEVLEIAQGYWMPMEELNELVSRLDVLACFAEVSNSAPTAYVRPTVNEKGEGSITLKGSRHPCLEVQDDVSFIANDVTLQRGENNFQIITGPNMGGKSTYIRQVGVIVLMAQIGCFVPCTSASVSIVDSILARVGAGDSQMKGVSTFMAEMLETASILKAATQDSLIIIDELGRGTSTYDGFGLAWSISEEISTKIGAYCLFATHFHELTALSEMRQNVKNFHVKALTTEKSLTLLYQVRPGVCDESFGIHVAELADFPQQVVNLAKRKAEELEGFAADHDATEAGSETPQKRQRREEKQRGCEIIRKFVADAAKLDTSMSDEDIMSRLSSMRDEVIKTNNQHVMTLLPQSA